MATEPQNPTPPKKRTSPYPRCRECGGRVRAESAQLIGFYAAKDKIEKHLLRGLYCCPDCLLDAWERGWPRKGAAKL